MASGSELVIPHKQTQTTAKQQLGSDDNKLPPGKLRLRCLQVDAGVKVGFMKFSMRAGMATASFFCSSVTAELANWPMASTTVWPCPCWAPETTTAITF